MAYEIDTVYEICDAEFPSQILIHKSGVREMNKHQTSTKAISSLKALFLPEVTRVARRDGLMAGVPASNYEAVAERLA